MSLKLLSAVVLCLKLHCLVSTRAEPAETCPIIIDPPWPSPVFYYRRSADSLLDRSFPAVLSCQPRCPTRLLISPKLVRFGYPESM